ncbi:MAG: class I tRNA ligase family protein, partial [Pseudomonadota bacterium]|nr:class I tRNA ligase family protein [Pseudomonadota bacterium]
DRFGYESPQSADKASRALDTYGADAARLFILSDSPPERDLEWTEAGIEGAGRFVSRLWRLVTEPVVPLPDPDAPIPAEISKTATALRRIAHRTIVGVTEDIEAFRLNRAVARIRELANAIADHGGKDAGGKEVLRETLEILVRLANPMMPHITEELWRILGHTRILAENNWPVADPNLVKADLIQMPVQVNGKLRATLDIPAEAGEDAVREAALADAKVLKAIGDAQVRKVIVVPGRIVNVVAR